MIDRRTADLIAIGQLTFAMIFRDIYYQFESVIAEHIHDVQITFLIRPANCGCLDSVVVQELGGSVRTIDRVTLGIQQPASDNSSLLSLGVWHANSMSISGILQNLFMVMFLL